MSQLKTYSELSRLRTLEERFRYLQLNGVPTNPTFGGRRLLNQTFYQSPEWRKVRRDVILRDNGCELGLEPFTIPGIVYIHHLNPITYEDILARDGKLLDPDNLICVSFDMHEAIHYGDAEVLKTYQLISRTPNDTCPWK